MTNYQWAVLILGILGFAITWTGAVIGATKAVEVIKADTSKKIADEVLARTNALASAAAARSKELEVLRAEFAEAQRTQDHNVGEMGAALRRFIETVEKEMHDIEIWGRDHYVQKPDFEKAIDKLSAEIKAGNADLKADLKDDLNELKAQIAAKN